MLQFSHCWNFSPYCCKKVFLQIRILNDIAQGMNFKYKIQPVRDNRKWGHVTYDGKESSGIVRDIMEEATDIGFQNFFIMPERYQWIGYLAPFMVERITCLARTPPADPKWKQLYRVFDQGSSRNSQHHHLFVILSILQNYG